MIHAIYRDDEVIVSLDGFPYVISAEDHRYDEVMDALEDEDEHALADILIRTRA